jgi:hypothetical protein
MEDNNPKSIADLSAEEIVALVNEEGKKYNEAVENEDTTLGTYFNEDAFDDNAITTLFLAYDVILNSDYGIENLKDQLEPGVELAFEGVQYEFKRRLGYADPYGNSSVINL